MRRQPFAALGIGLSPRSTTLQATARRRWSTRSGHLRTWTRSGARAAWLDGLAATWTPLTRSYGQYALIFRRRFAVVLILQAG
jgi:hypothetical protein